ncbi:energy-coupling factor ABC transporter ATP-binding protein [Paenarthrobacter sp. DKR-5]|uniref:ABC transporter ATP-binding protein n=1 Tax=Paenarthrobacter sp. DKR-5 TaxID=2835535 RepID=UPI001BDBDBA1|nr:ABC transporter ATP-binding protein [Paenarthrobacter sp. DKR-5]MBT1002075.1 energy-coupling factor ABC transporter ATP-binding protein [Paenarthrobacter sp. DKR-5]
MISLDCAGFTYHGAVQPALGRVRIQAAAGSATAVVGGAGSGKTTAARLLAGHLTGAGRLVGALRLDGAELRFDGGADDPSLDFARWSEVVGFVGQRPRAQLSGVKDTVADELAYALENRGVPRERMVVQVRHTAELLGIAELLPKSPLQLSGGELQKTVIAASVIAGPRVLVLDEPMSGLDAEARKSLAQLLDVLLGEGLALVVAEQGLQGYAPRAAQVAVLDGGKLVLEGSWREVAASDRLARLPVNGNPYAELARQAAGLGGVGAGGARAAGPEAAALEAAALPLTESEALRFFAGLRPAAGVRVRPVRAAAPGLAGSVPAHDGPAATLRGVTFRYPPPASAWTGRVRRRSEPAAGRPALDGVCLDIPRGRRTAVIGANGAGKTTLLRHLNGLAVPQEGTVDVGGLRTAGHPVGELARCVGYLFQDADSQLFQRTVQREVEFGLRSQGASKAEAAERAAAALERCGLGAVAGEHPFELSFSDRRLVALASILAAGPDVLALDEPTVALDKAGLSLLAGLMREEAAAGRAVVMVTHDLDFAVAQCDDLVLLRDGRLADRGPVLDVVQRLFPAGEQPPEGLTAPLLWKLAEQLDLQPAALTSEAFLAALRSS